MSLPSSPPPPSSPSPDSARLAVLLDETLDGRPGAWGELWTATLPIITAVTRCSRWTSRLARDLDEREDIAVRVMERLSADDFQALVDFRESRRTKPGRSLCRWLGRIARNTSVSHVRSYPEFLGSDPAGEGRTWVLKKPLSAAGDPAGEESADPLDLIDAHRIEALFGSALTETQRAALGLSLQDVADEDIATKLGLSDARRAGKEVRSAVQRLRRRTSGWEEELEEDGEENRQERVTDRSDKASSSPRRAEDRRMSRRGPPR